MQAFANRARGAANALGFYRDVFSWARVAITVLVMTLLILFISLLAPSSAHATTSSSDVQANAPPGISAEIATEETNIVTSDDNNSEVTVVYMEAVTDSENNVSDLQKLENEASNGKETAGDSESNDSDKASNGNTLDKGDAKPDSKATDNGKFDDSADQKAKTNEQNVAAITTPADQGRDYQSSDESADQKADIPSTVITEITTLDVQGSDYRSGATALTSANTVLANTNGKTSSSLDSGKEGGEGSYIANDGNMVSLVSEALSWTTVSDGAGNESDIASISQVIDIDGTMYTLTYTLAPEAAPVSVFGSDTSTSNAGYILNIGAGTGSYFYNVKNGSGNKFASDAPVYYVSPTDGSYTYIGSGNLVIGINYSSAWAHDEEDYSDAYDNGSLPLSMAWLPTLASPGYTFGGWSKKALTTSSRKPTVYAGYNGKNPTTNNRLYDYYDPDDPTIYYAMWTPYPITVTFTDPNLNSDAAKIYRWVESTGNTNVSTTYPSTSEHSFIDTEVYEPEYTTLDGYDFLGWAYLPYASGTSDSFILKSGKSVHTVQGTNKTYYLKDDLDFDRGVVLIKTSSTTPVVVDSLLTATGDLTDLTSDYKTSVYLTAVWGSEGSNISVTFASADNHGSMSGSQTTASVPSDSGSNYLTQAQINAAGPTPATGYEFDYWTLGDAGNKNSGTHYATDAALLAAPISASTTYAWAHWKKVQYTVTFQSNSDSQGTLGGSTTPKVLYGESLSSTQIGAVTKSPKAGYVFGYWTVGANTTNQYTDAQLANVVINGSTTVYAHWKQQFTVTFTNSDTSKGTLGGTTSTKVADGETLTSAQISAATLTPASGYDFDYWKVGTSTTKYSAASLATVPITGNTTVTVYWKQTKYFVSFESENLSQGTLSGSTTALVNMTAPNNYLTTSQINAVTQNPADGYVFDYWNVGTTTQRRSSADLTSVAITGNTTITAHWAVKQCSVTFQSASNSQGTVGGTTTASVPEGQKLTTAQINAVTLSPVDGYEFDYWTVGTNTTTHYNNTQLANVTISSDIIVKANWKAKSYTVTFDRNGPTSGSNPDNQTTTWTGTVTRPTPNPEWSNSGKKFEGWFLSGDTSETVLISPTTTSIAYNTLATNAGKNSATTTLALKAKWGKITYTVHYNTNGGAETIADASVKYDDPIPLPASVSKLGYSEDGWYFGTTQVNTGEKYSKYGNSAEGSVLEIDLHWKEQIVTIVYHSNDPGATISHTSGSENAKTITEYVGAFTGDLYTDASGTTKVTGAVTNISDGIRPIYAKDSNNREVYEYSNWYRNVNNTDQVTSANATKFVPDKSGGVFGDADYYLHVTPRNFRYVVKYHTQKLDGTYEHVQLDGDGSNGGRTAPYNSSVSVQGWDIVGDTVVTPATITGFTYSKDVTASEGNGYIASIVHDTGSASGSPNVLNLYYTRNAYTYSYDYNSVGKTAKIALPTDLTASTKNASDKTIKYNDVVSIPAVPEVFGYTWKGWSGTYGNGASLAITDDLTNRTATFNMPAGVVTLVGKWEAIKYDVKYINDTNPNHAGFGTVTLSVEGSSYNVDSTNGKTMSFSYGSTLPTPTTTANEPTTTAHKGYYFIGFEYLDAAGSLQRTKDLSSLLFTEDNFSFSTTSPHVTLTARWDIIISIVYTDGSGGHGAFKQVSKSSMDQGALIPYFSGTTSNACNGAIDDIDTDKQNGGHPAAKVGYVFKGWCTDPDGKNGQWLFDDEYSNHYADADLTMTGTWTAESFYVNGPTGESRTFYAQFVPTTQNLEFQTGNGTVSGSFTDSSHALGSGATGSQYEVPSDLVVPGYSLTAWTYYDENNDLQTITMTSGNPAYVTVGPGKKSEASYTYVFTPVLVETMVEYSYELADGCAGMGSLSTTYEKIGATTGKTTLGALLQGAVATPTDEHYYFAGWYMSKDHSGTANTVTAAILSKTTSENDTLKPDMINGVYTGGTYYAYFLPFSYSVTIRVDDEDKHGILNYSDPGTGNPRTGTQYPNTDLYYYNTKFTTILDSPRNITVTADAGYEHTGWKVKIGNKSTSYSLAEFSSVIVSDASVLSPVFTEKRYTVNYVTNGGTPNLDSKTVSWTGSIKPNTTSNFIRTGYEFKGWYVDSNFGTNYVVGAAGYDETFASAAEAYKRLNNGSYPTTSITLYAKWQALNHFSVTYNARVDASGNPSETSDEYPAGTTNPATVAGVSWEADNLIPTGVTVPDGWTLDGWYVSTTSKDDIGKPSTYITSSTKYGDLASVDTPNSSITLFAHWTHIQYKVEYKNGGNVDYTEYLYWEDAIPEHEPKNVPVEQYFDYWRYDTGSGYSPVIIGTSEAPGTTVSQVALGNTSNTELTLLAELKRNQSYTVSYYLLNRDADGNYSAETTAIREERGYVTPFTRVNIDEGVKDTDGTTYYYWTKKPVDFGYAADTNGTYAAKAGKPNVVNYESSQNTGTTNDLKFVLCFYEKTYTIVYDTGVTDLNADSRTVGWNGTPITPVPAVTRDGYDAPIWKYGTTEITDGTSVSSLLTPSRTDVVGSDGSTVVLTAEWSVATAELSYSAKEKGSASATTSVGTVKKKGEAVGSSSTSETVNAVGQTPTVIVAEVYDPDYKLLGWYYNDGTTDVPVLANTTGANSLELAIGAGTDAKPLVSRAYFALFDKRSSLGYTVEHYYMDTAGNYGDTPDATESGSGLEGDTVLATSKAITTMTGLTHRPNIPGSISSITLESTDEAHRTLKLYYEREHYNVTVIGSAAGADRPASLPTIDSSALADGVYYDATADLPTVTVPSGWTLTWKVDDNSPLSAGSTTFKVQREDSGTVTLTGVWTREKYRVTFTRDAGTPTVCGINPQPKTYENIPFESTLAAEGYNYTADIAMTTPSGYTVVGWKVLASDTAQVLNAQIENPSLWSITQNTTFVPQWKKIYTITYYSGDHAASGTDAYHEFGPYSEEEAGTTTLPKWNGVGKAGQDYSSQSATPTAAAGYQFLGWTWSVTNNDTGVTTKYATYDTGDSSVTIVPSLDDYKTDYNYKFTAAYEALARTLVFDLSGVADPTATFTNGSNTMTINSYHTGDTITSDIPGDSDVTRSGYKLLGWKVATEGITDTETYIATKGYTIPETTVGTIRFVPDDTCWKLETVTISYEIVTLDDNLGHATLSVSSEDVAATEAAAGGSVVKPDPGYEYDGWYYKVGTTLTAVDPSWVTGLDTDGDSVIDSYKIVPTKPTTGGWADATYAVKIKAGKTYYTVWYYMQDPDLNGYTHDTNVVADKKVEKVPNTNDDVITGSEATIAGNELTGAAATGFTLAAGAAAGDPNYPGKITVLGTGQSVLKVYYDRVTNNVAYSYTGDKSSNPGTTDGPVICGATVTLPASNLPGYTVSWSAHKSGDASTVVTITDDAFIMPAYDVAVTGTWSALAFPLDYDTGVDSSDPYSGTVAGIPADSTFAWDASNVLPAVNPTRTGYTLGGWVIVDKAIDSIVGELNAANHSALTYGDLAKKAYGTTAYTDEISLAETVYSHGGLLVIPLWEEKTNAVSYDIDGESAGKGKWVNGFTPVTSVATDDSLTAPLAENVHKDGKTLDKWTYSYTDPVGGAMSGELNPGDTLTMPAATVTLVPMWANKTYSVTYNTGSGTAVSSRDNDVLWDSANLDINPLDGLAYNPTRTGYDFDHWTYNGGAVYETDMAYSALVANDGVTSVELTAAWKPRTYLVKFDGNGATGAVDGYTAEQTMTFDDFDATLNANGYKLSGKSFRGWATAPNATEPKYLNRARIGENLVAEPLKNGMSSFTLYALWGEVEYKVAYTNLDGVVGGTYETGRRTTWTATDLDKNASGVAYAPEKTGYTFKGWTYGPSNTVYDSTPYSTVADDDDSVDEVVLRAKWQANAYAVKFDKNGGAGEMSDQGMTYDLEATLTPNAFIQPGFTFLGWAESADATAAKYTNGQSVKNLRSAQGDKITLYAVWSRNSYTVRYDGNGAADGTYVTSRTVIWTDTGLDKDASGAPYKPEKTGYTFKGWTYGAPAADYVTTMPYSAVAGADSVKEITLKAKWQANSYTVVFDKNGGAGTMADEPMVYDTEKNLTTNTFTFAGRTFLGWAESKDATSVKYTDGKAVKNLRSAEGDKITLYAVWSRNAYTVNYNTDGATAGSYDTTRATTWEATGLDKNASGVVYAPEKTGYSFKGWTYGAPAADYVTTMPYSAVAGADSVKEITLKAKWQANTYSVAFNKNNGTGEMSNQGMTYDQSANLSANTFTRSGYEFIGWAESANATTAKYTNGQSVKNLRSNQGDTITLYAVWSALSYKVHFEKNATDSTGTMADQTLFVDRAQALSANAFARVGYTFTGWAENKNDTAAKYTNGQTVKNLSTVNGAVVTLYAVWAPSAYTVRYNLDGVTGGTYDESRATTWVATDLDKSASGAAYAPLKTGYTFKGWTYGSNTPYNATPYSTIAGNDDSVKEVTLKAVWQANTYTVAFDKNGGTGTMADEPMTYDANKALTKNAFTFTGRTFAGWAESADATAAKYTDGQTVKNLKSVQGSKITLYAVWTMNAYTVRYDGNGAIGGSYVASRNVLWTDADLDKTAAGVAYAPTKTGYTFKGWTYGSSNTDYNATTPYSTIAGADTVKEITLKAKWTANAYKVVFEANNGSGDKTTQTMTYDQAQKLTSNTYKYAGRTFAGWAESATATSAKYTNGQSVTNLVAAPVSDGSSSKSLYAVWSRNTYTVNYNTAGGSAVASRTGVMWETTGLDKSAAGTTYAPTRTGYDFAGWTYGSNTAYTTNTAYSTVAGPGNDANGSSITLTAAWKNKVFHVIFDDGFDSVISGVDVWSNNPSDTTTYNYARYQSDTSSRTNNISWNQANWLPMVIGNSSVALTPTRAGYDFTGWVYGADKTALTAKNNATVTYAMLADGDDSKSIVAITATWAPRTYRVVYQDVRNGALMSDTTTNLWTGGWYDTATTINRSGAKDGYTFVGWTTDKDGENAFVADKYYNLGTSNAAIKAKPDTNKTSSSADVPVVYAQWKKNVSFGARVYKEDGEGNLIAVNVPTASLAGASWTSYEDQSIKVSTAGNQVSVAQGSKADGVAAFGTRAVPEIMGYELATEKSILAIDKLSATGGKQYVVLAYKPKTSSDGSDDPDKKYKVVYKDETGAEIAPAKYVNWASEDLAPAEEPIKVGYKPLGYGWRDAEGNRVDSATPYYELATDEEGYEDDSITSVSLYVEWTKRQYNVNYVDSTDINGNELEDDEYWYISSSNRAKNPVETNAKVTWADEALLFEIDEEGLAATNHKNGWKFMGWALTAEDALAGTVINDTNLFSTLFKRQNVDVDEKTLSTYDDSSAVNSDGLTLHAVWAKYVPYTVKYYTSDDEGVTEIVMMDPENEDEELEIVHGASGKDAYMGGVATVVGDNIDKYRPIGYEAPTTVSSGKLQSENPDDNVVKVVYERIKDFKLLFDRNVPGATAADIIDEATLDNLTWESTAYRQATATPEIPGYTLKGKEVRWSTMRDANAEGALMFALGTSYEEIAEAIAAAAGTEVDDLAIRTSGLTLYAQWTEKKEFKVEYDLNNKKADKNDDTTNPNVLTDVDDSRNPVDVEDLKKDPVGWTEKGFDESTELDAAPTGYEFDGWNTKRDGSGLVVSDNTEYGHISNDVDSTTEQKSVTLYAQWKETLVEINYTTNGGGTIDRFVDKVSAVTGTPIAEGSSSGTQLTSTATAKPGYHFVKWVRLANGMDASGGSSSDMEALAMSLKALADGATNQTSVSGTTLSVDKSDSDGILHSETYEALFEINDDATLVYDANGGTGTIDGVTEPYESLLTLADGSGFKRSYYTLEGWNTKADGTGTMYALGTQEYELPEGETTLYAIWKANTYDVTIGGGKMTAGGTVSELTIPVAYNETVPADAIDSITVTPDPGKMLVGWKYTMIDDETGKLITKTVDKLSDLVITGEVTFEPVFADDPNYVDPNAPAKDNGDGDDDGDGYYAGTRGMASTLPPTGDTGFAGIFMIMIAASLLAMWMAWRRRNDDSDDPQSQTASPAKRHHGSSAMMFVIAIAVIAVVGLTPSMALALEDENSTAAIEIAAIEADALDAEIDDSASESVENESDFEGEIEGAETLSDGSDSSAESARAYTGDDKAKLEGEKALSQSASSPDKAAKDAKNAKDSIDELDADKKAKEKAGDDKDKTADKNDENAKDEKDKTDENADQDANEEESEDEDQELDSQDYLLDEETLENEYGLMAMTASSADEGTQVDTAEGQYYLEEFVNSNVTLGVANGKIITSAKTASGVSNHWDITKVPDETGSGGDLFTIKCGDMFLACEDGQLALVSSGEKSAQWRIASYLLSNSVVLAIYSASSDLAFGVSGDKTRTPLCFESDSEYPELPKAREFRWIAESVLAMPWNIVLDPNGGLGTMGVDNVITVTGGEPSPALVNQFTRAGYSFTGWIDNEGTSYDNGATIEREIYVNGFELTLTAQWAENSVEVTYTAGNGGTVQLVSDGIAKSVVSETVGAVSGVIRGTASQTFSGSTAVADRGYHFVGWTVEGVPVTAEKNGLDASEKTSTTLSGTTVSELSAAADTADGDSVYHALSFTSDFAANTYTVQYNANGGSGIVAASSATYGENGVLASASTLSQDGYEFSGWNTAADGSGLTVSDGATLSTDTLDKMIASGMISGTGDDTTTLYAQWTALPAPEPEPEPAPAPEPEPEPAPVEEYIPIAYEIATTVAETVVEEVTKPVTTVTETLKVVPVTTTPIVTQGALGSSTSGNASSAETASADYYYSNYAEGGGAPEPDIVEAFANMSTTEKVQVAGNTVAAVAAVSTMAALLGVGASVAGAVAAGVVGVAGAAGATGAADLAAELAAASTVSGGLFNRRRKKSEEEEIAEGGAVGSR